MSKKPTIGPKEFDKLIDAGIVNVDLCRQFVRYKISELGSYPDELPAGDLELARLCRRVLRSRVNQKALWDRARKVEELEPVRPTYRPPEQRRTVPPRRTTSQRRWKGWIMG